MVKLNSQSQKIDMIFVMLLFILFATTSFMLILVGVKQYQVTANTMKDNYELRAASSYLTEKIRQSDNTLGVELADLDQTQAIALNSVIDDTNYVTYIYYYDGYLRELVVDDSSVFTVESGQEVIELSNFTIEKQSEDVAKVTITSTRFKSIDVYINLTPVN